eukprot:RCo024258
MAGTHPEKTRHRCGTRAKTVWVSVNGGLTVSNWYCELRSALPAPQRGNTLDNESHVVRCGAMGATNAHSEDKRNMYVRGLYSIGSQHGDQQECGNTLSLSPSPHLWLRAVDPYTSCFWAASSTRSTIGAATVFSVSSPPSSSSASASRSSPASGSVRTRRHCRSSPMSIGDASTPSAPKFTVRDTSQMWLGITTKILQRPCCFQLRMEVMQSSSVAVTNTKSGGSPERVGPPHDSESGKDPLWMCAPAYFTRARVAWRRSASLSSTSTTFPETRHMLRRRWAGRAHRKSSQQSPAVATWITCPPIRRKR